MGELEQVRKIKVKYESKQKALEPKQLLCKILQKKVTILVEYLDYKGKYHPSEIGEIFCSNMLQCYQNKIKCKYSGISKFFPDPFDKNFNDEFYKDFVGNKEFKKIQKLRKQKNNE